MTVLYFLIPLAGVLVAAALVAFFAAARDGQFDDLDTPPIRVLFDDPPARPKSMTEETSS
ncbi:MAG: cbb3-type cytochrome oxidase assembly protein CcoS [Deltaproteobacteria bacterium]|nr:cbb3-type cytochrome oxidase assembly protein CcoS [Deltaproteobacteria bacterium]